MLKIQIIYAIVFGFLLAATEWLAGGPVRTLGPLAPASVMDKVLLLPVVGFVYIAWGLWIATVAGVVISWKLMRSEPTASQRLIRLTKVLPCLAIAVVIAHAVAWTVAAFQSPVTTPQLTVVVTAQGGAVAILWDIVASLPLALLWLHGVGAGSRARRAAGPTCPSCGYSLLGLEGGTCPECGAAPNS